MAVGAGVTLGTAEGVGADDGPEDAPADGPTDPIAAPVAVSDAERSPPTMVNTATRPTATSARRIPYSASPWPRARCREPCGPDLLRWCIADLHDALRSPTRAPSDGEHRSDGSTRRWPGSTGARRHRYWWHRYWRSIARTVSGVLPPARSPFGRETVTLPIARHRASMGSRVRDAGGSRSRDSGDGSRPRTGISTAAAGRPSSSAEPRCHGPARSDDESVARPSGSDSAAEGPLAREARYSTNAPPSCHQPPLAARVDAVRATRGDAGPESVRSAACP